jgi:predicted negative regulator of RcsB-dependent stress response
VDRRTRKDLKSDKFALEVQHGFEFITDHKQEAIRYGSIALAALLIVGGIYLYVRHQAAARQDALAQALRIDAATVGNKAVQEVQVGAMHFNTDAEKNAALTKAMTDVAVKYSGTDEAATAEFYLASNAVDKGNLTEAEKRFKEIVDHAPAAYAALAKLSLSRVYESEGKDDQAQKLLQDLIAHPTVTVSKGEAQLRLAALIGRKNPDEARKMLEAMRTDRTAISRAAVQELGNLATR